MGYRENISYEKFPAQTAFVGQEVMVCFAYDTSRLIPGRVVRDDREDPHTTIIALNDGRFVLADECQYANVIGASPVEIKR